MAITPIDMQVNMGQYTRWPREKPCAPPRSRGFSRPLMPSPGQSPVRLQTGLKKTRKLKIPSLHDMKRKKNENGAERNDRKKRKRKNPLPAMRGWDFLSMF